MTNRNIYCLVVLLLLCATGARAQDIPTIEVILSQNTARVDDIVTANVYVRTPLEIIGADVEITVDETCLLIEDRNVGDYFPTGEGQSFTIHEETTENSTRLAMNVLDFNLIPIADGLFYSVPLKVICEEAEASVDVTFAHLVQRGVIDFKADEGQINLINATLTIDSGTQAISTQSVEEEQAATTASTTATATAAPTQDTSNNSLLIGALVVVVVFGIGLILLFIWYRRPQPKRE